MSVVEYDQRFGTFFFKVILSFVWEYLILQMIENHRLHAGNLSKHHLIMDTKSLD